MNGRGVTVCGYRGGGGGDRWTEGGGRRIEGGKAMIMGGGEGWRWNVWMATNKRR